MSMTLPHATVSSRGWLERIDPRTKLAALAAISTLSVLVDSHAALCALAACGLAATALVPAYVAHPRWHHRPGGGHRVGHAAEPGDVLRSTAAHHARHPCPRLRAVRKTVRGPASLSRGNDVWPGPIIADGRRDLGGAGGLPLDQPRAIVGGLGATAPCRSR